MELPPLHQWQEDALRKWKRAKRCGVVEAVTGTGKTMVGIAAAAEELQLGGRVLVVVPTIELQHQWKKQIEKHIPDDRITIGLLGAGRRGDLTRCDILISVVNSARLRDISPPRNEGLIIADECHRYGSRMNKKALSNRFPRRLGLTATFERSDDGHIEWLEPYFGPRCFQIGYARAIGDGVVARFKVGLVGTRFAGAREYGLYEKLSTEVGKLKRKLVEGYGLKEEPFGEFMYQVATLKKYEPLSPAGRAASKFLKSFADRRRMLADAKVKYDTLIKLEPAIRSAERVLVFTETIVGAELATRVLRRRRLRVECVHSKMRMQERRETLDAFSKGKLQVIVAPKVLDEGIDVQAADLAVIVAASKSKRQMIQRMGRVIRTKLDHRLARFAVIFIEETSEDPAQGAHEDFLDELIGVADDVTTFSADESDELVNGYLRP